MVDISIINVAVFNSILNIMEKVMSDVPLIVYVKELCYGNKTHIEKGQIFTRNLISLFSLMT
jgi:hypothetical protein